MDTSSHAPAAPEVGGFRRAEIGVGGQAQTERLARLLDLQGRQPGVLRLREWATSRLAPRPGETVVDVGSGTGEVVVGFARLVGAAGRVVGVEPNPAMRGIASTRSGFLPGVEFVDGAAEELPFEDATVDVVFCERVFQHLDDPDAAVREFARVLRPGGRVALLDSDWATSITHPGDPDVIERYQSVMFRQWPNPFSGRRLRGHLVRAGLEVDPDVGSSALVLPDEPLHREGMVGMAAGAAVAAGVVTQAELDRLFADLDAAAERGEAFLSVTMFAVIGRVPQ